MLHNLLTESVDNFVDNLIHTALAPSKHMKYNKLINFEPHNKKQSNHTLRLIDLVVPHKIMYLTDRIWFT